MGHLPLKVQPDRARSLPPKESFVYIRVYRLICVWSIRVCRRLGVFGFGPLDPWTLGPLDLWTFGPLDRWTFVPLDLWAFGPLDHQGPMIQWSKCPMVKGSVQIPKRLRIQWFKDPTVRPNIQGSKGPSTSPMVQGSKGPSKKPRVPGSNERRISFFICWLFYVSLF